ncbi:MAG: hypothetical protein ACLFTQ_03795, partial [Candidatus Aenigmatarchaeota archaeon]
MQLRKLAASALGSLMAGATLAFPVAAADLEDLPEPFIEGEEAAFSMVVGETAATEDVVGAIDVAVSMGGQPTVEETVETEGGVASWSAEEGITLNRENSNLFLDDATDAEENRLDDRDLDVLESTEFTSEDNEDVEVEYEAQVGEQDQDFNADVGDLDDPVLHVENPYGNDVNAGDAEDYLFQATVDFSDTMDFEAAGDDDLDDIDGDADEALEDGDEISLFGTEYTFSDKSDQGTLVLYESSETFDVEHEEEETVDIEGEEHTFETVTVAEDGDEATIRVDGELEEVDEDSDDEVTVGDTDVRVTEIYSTGPDGEGVVEFAIGSDEVEIHEEGEVELEGDEVDGVNVNVDGAEGNKFDNVNSIDFAFGATDSDEDYVEAGDTYTDPVFEALEFHYGGVAADAAEDAEETIEVEVEEEEDAVISMTDDNGDDADITFAHDEADDGETLSVDDGEHISTYDGESVEEDDYVVLNQNEEGAMYQVTDIDNTDLEDDNDDDDGELSVELENVFTGESTTVEDDGIDFEGDNTHTLKDESIEGMDFDVEFDDADEDPTVRFENSIDSEGTAVYPAIYSATDGAVAFMDDEPATIMEGVDIDSDGDIDETVKLPSTKSSGDQLVEVSTNESAENYTIGDNEDVSWDGESSVDETVTVGEIDYEITLDNDRDDFDAQDEPDDVDVEVRVDDPNLAASGAGDDKPTAMFMQPEDDEEEEHAYVFTPNDLDDDGELEEQYTGTEYVADNDDDIEVGYNLYGSYQEFDDDSDDESFELGVPEAQSTSGMAVTGTDGELSAEGGGGSVEYDKVVPVYHAIGS